MIGGKFSIRCNKKLFYSSFFSSLCRSFVCKLHLDIQLFVRFYPVPGHQNTYTNFDCSKFESKVPFYYSFFETQWHAL